MPLRTRTDVDQRYRNRAIWTGPALLVVSFIGSALILGDDPPFWTELAVRLAIFLPLLLAVFAAGFLKPRWEWVSRSDPRP